MTQKLDSKSVVLGNRTAGAAPVISPSPPVRPSVVIGLGSPLRGDDGVGVRVAELLAARRLPPEVEVIDGGTQGLGIVALMEGRQRVIFVDAANMGQEPGQVIRFALEEVLLAGDDRPLNVHSAGLRDALLLARALGTLPSDVVVYGVQPASIEWDSTLSQEVEAVLPDLVEAVLTEVTISRR